MQEPNAPLYQLLLNYRAQWAATQATPSVANQSALEQSDAELWLAFAPMMLRLAQQVMRSGSRGRDHAEPGDLASAVSMKLFSSRPILSGFLDGSIEAYLTTTLKNAYLDDLARLVGRNEHMPRIYVDLDEPVTTNSLASDRRTQSGYYALKQTRHHLDAYLRQIPGSVVQIAKGGKTPGIKTVRLTKGHADLLRQWMAGDGNLAWAEIAKRMARPEGTVKRWFAEVTRHFLTDTAPDAVALRGLFGVDQQDFPKGDDLDDDPDAEEVV